MKILSIQKSKILFENNIEISLQIKTIKEYELKEGMSIEENLYLDLLESAILSFSYWVLSKRDYGKKELYDKLYLKYRNKALVNKVVSQLEERGYLDDISFAKAFVNSHKSWGIKKIEFNLKLKGVSSEVIKEVLWSEEEEESQIETIQKAWKKLGSREERKKIESLMRKGFRYEDIKTALRDIDD